MVTLYSLLLRYLREPYLILILCMRLSVVLLSQSGPSHKTYQGSNEEAYSSDPVQYTYDDKETLVEESKDNETTNQYQYA